MTKYFKIFHSPLAVIVGEHVALVAIKSVLYNVEITTEVTTKYHTLHAYYMALLSQSYLFSFHHFFSEYREKPKVQKTIDPAAQLLFLGVWF